jgi:hypothetical protein
LKCLTNVAFLECTGSYDAASDRPREKLSVFHFPADVALRDKWYKSVPRNPEEYKNNKRPPVVCGKHFSTEFIVREDKVTRSDGTVLSVLRKKPKLTENAYPTIFPNAPSYQSSEPPRKRKTPVDRRQEMSRRDEQRFNDWMASDRIESFDEMSDKIDDLSKRYLESKWIIKHLKDCVCIGLTDFEDWGALNQKERRGRLSDETMFTLKHTVVTLAELIVYLLNDLHLSFTLFRKFQTDSLEYRLCFHRRLSGTNYHCLCNSSKNLRRTVAVQLKGRMGFRDEGQ